MKKLTALLLALVFACVLPAAAFAAAPAAPTDGVYEGSARGFRDQVSVEVVLDGGRISGVSVTQHAESPGLSDNAIEFIPRDIVLHQSFAVDAVSGSTVTSAAIKAAVRSALGDAADQFSAAPEYTQTAETLTYDVVTIGTGAAGLTAAIEASANGATVLMLEKQGRFGGSTITSSGMVYATGNSFSDEIDDSPEALADYMQERAEGEANYDMLLFFAEHSGETVEWLLDKGVPLLTGNVIPVGTSPVRRTVFTDGGGAVFVKTLLNKALDQGADVLYGTRATELIVDDNGAVVGVKAESKQANYTINAGAVVLATGGFDANEELKREHTPDAVGIANMANVGNTGDGILMGQAVGAATEFHSGVLGFRAVNTAIPFMDSYNGFTWDGSMYVTPDGNRFVNEGSGDVTINYLALYNTGYDVNYTIVDATGGERAELAAQQGFAFKGDTIEALAKAAGIDAEALLATVALWNEDAEKGLDSQFGNTRIKALGDGPYYALKTVRASAGCFGGLIINTDSEVLNDDGAAIPGLYAAGEVATAQIFGQAYTGSGTMLGLASTFGRIAGGNAAAYAK